MAHTHTQTETNTHTYTHADTHTDQHADTHTHTHTDTHTDTGPDRSSKHYMVTQTHTKNVKYQSKVWTHILIQGLSRAFLIFTIFYIVENSEDIRAMK
jgi:hypothetical protein